MTVQAFYTYTTLATMWSLHPDTIKGWVTALRRDAPDLVYVTYRLVKGHRRTAFLASMTVDALQDRHFPRNAEQPKRRGKGQHSGWTNPRTTVADQERERAAQAPTPTPPAPQAAPSSPPSAAAPPQPPTAPPPRAVRKLVLPPIPRREDRPAGSAIGPLSRTVTPSVTGR